MCLCKKILVLGGAGFIGSHIANSLACEGYNVTIVDGLFNGTGGCKNNILKSENLLFIDKPIQEIEDLNDFFAIQDIIIDSMGWTSHIDAFKNPVFDLNRDFRGQINPLINCS